MDIEGVGKRQPRSVLVPISAAEVELCRDFAVECESIRSYSRKRGWKGGLCPAMRLYGGVDVDETISGIVIGKVGEVALCKLANSPIDIAMRHDGDGGKDVKLPCGFVQVKTSRKIRPGLVRDPVEQVDWFVFATWNGVSPNVELHGYASRSQIAALPSVPSPRGSWMNKEVSFFTLRHVDQLLKIRPIGDVL